MRTRGTEQQSADGIRKKLRIRRWLHFLHAREDAKQLVSCLLFIRLCLHVLLIFAMLEAAGARKNAKERITVFGMFQRIDYLRYTIGVLKKSNYVVRSCFSRQKSMMSVILPAYFQNQTISVRSTVMRFKQEQ